MKLLAPIASLTLLFALPVAVACNTTQAQGKASAESATPASASPGSSPLADAKATAEIGKAAPGFTLKDLDGKTVSLSDFKGKTVVLEWFNPQCPFVKKSHTVGSLKGYAKGVTGKGVVWLAINSGAAGKQGAGVDANKQGITDFSLTNPILLDETGAVGKAYGATNTPHMYVIDPKGVLVYRGAIDNSPDAEGQSPTGGTLVNYVDQALTELEGSKPVSVADTKAYGCTVKY